MLTDSSILRGIHNTATEWAVYIPNPDIRSFEREIPKYTWEKEKLGSRALFLVHMILQSVTMTIEVAFGIFTASLSIITLGRSSDINQLAINNLGQSETVLVHTMEDFVKVLNPNATVSSGPSCASRVDKYWRGGNKPYDKKKWNLLVRCSAPFYLVAMVAARIADLIIAVVSIAGACFALGNSPLLNKYALSGLAFGGLPMDFYRAFMLFVRPSEVTSVV